MQMNRLGVTQGDAASFIESYLPNIVPGRVIVACPGNGSLMKELTSRGFEPIGVQPTVGIEENYLNICRRQTNRLAITYADGVEFFKRPSEDLQESCSAVIVTSLEMLLTQDREGETWRVGDAMLGRNLKRLTSGCFSLLAPGGILAISMMAPDEKNASNASIATSLLHQAGTSSGLNFETSLATQWMWSKPGVAKQLESPSGSESSGPSEDTEPLNPSRPEDDEPPTPETDASEPA